MKLEPQLEQRGTFTAGICATGDFGNLRALSESVLAEGVDPRFILKKLVIVASQCPAPVVSELRDLQAGDARVHLVWEEVRRGKAEAVNKILGTAEGEFVVLLNSDASFDPGAIAELLATASSDPTVGAVSAMPLIRKRGGLGPTLVDLMWTTHNECSLALNHMNLSNHACDELVVFRLKAISRLPEGLVNDGAFLAGTARRKGYSIKLSQGTRVHITTPVRVPDLISQRRRILFGHAQVWRKVGNPPKTIESLLVLSPMIGLRLLAATVARNPRFVLMLPVAVVTEFLAATGAIWDTFRSTGRHAVWRRFS